MQKKYYRRCKIFVNKSEIAVSVTKRLYFHPGYYLKTNL